MSPRYRTRDLPNPGRQSAGNFPKTGVVYVFNGRTEIDVVKEVEKLHFKRKINVLCDWKPLHEGCIPVLYTEVKYLAECPGSGA